MDLYLQIYYHILPQNMDKNSYSQWHSKMIVLIVLLTRFFKNSVSEEYCSDLFIKKSEYLLTCLLVTWVFSPKIDLITCVCVYTEDYLVHHAFQILSSRPRLGSQINNFKIPLVYQFLPVLQDLTDVFIPLFDVEISHLEQEAVWVTSFCLC